MAAHDTDQRDPNWHRALVGGMWDTIGHLQFEFLVGRGLQSHHQLLDIGCGSLRGGVHFIRYLETGHYSGVDKDRALLDAGRTEELSPELIAQKQPRLVEMADFTFATLGRRFDYALAQSVFTHLPLNNIMRCLVNIEQALAPGGEFYATFFENALGMKHVAPILRIAEDCQFPTYCDADPFHYPFDAFEWMCRDLNLSVEYLGEWNHPRCQRMIVFRRPV